MPTTSEMPFLNSISLSCRTSSSATPAGMRMSCCRELRAWKRKAPSPAPKGASSDFTRCLNRWKVAGRTGRSHGTLPTAWERRGTQSGTWVQLVSRYGQVRVRALVTDRVHGMELYMPMNSVESPVNRLTSSHTDPVTNTPAYKETSVNLKVLPEVGENPLPRNNSRFGHPTPQNGVEVERKWKRPDYTQPGNGLVQLRTNQ